jgi:macrodomain Ter protein organizer (MatP/YcbG family)
MTKNKIISSNLDSEYFQLLSDYAKKKGLTLSSAIRLIIIESFDNQ